MKHRQQSDDARADHSAAALAYEKHATELTRFAAGLVGRSDARDVVSSAIVKAFAARDWRTIDNIRAYLYRAVYSEVVSARRRRTRGRALQERLEANTTLVLEENLTPLVVDARRALEALSVRQRAAIVLTYWQDLKPDQVGERLGISEGAVRKHLARARRRLREVLDA